MELRVSLDFFWQTPHMQSPYSQCAMIKNIYPIIGSYRAPLRITCATKAFSCLDTLSNVLWVHLTYTQYYETELFAR